MAVNARMRGSRSNGKPAVREVLRRGERGGPIPSQFGSQSQPHEVSPRRARPCVDLPRYKHARDPSAFQCWEPPMAWSVPAFRQAWTDPVPAFVQGHVLPFHSPFPSLETVTPCPGSFRQVCLTVRGPQFQKGCKRANDARGGTNSAQSHFVGKISRIDMANKLDGGDGSVG